MKRLTRWTIYPILFVLLVGLGMRIAGFRVFRYEAERNSMHPTISPDDVVLCITEKSYSTYSIKRGAVILIEHDEFPYPLTKRVIGLPGDHVKIEGLDVFINWEKLDEPYLSGDLPDKNYGEIRNLKVPPDKLFVMGDNRADSLDSRYSRFGLVSAGQVIGKPLLILLSQNRSKIGKRLN